MSLFGGGFLGNIASAITGSVKQVVSAAAPSIGAVVGGNFGPIGAAVGSSVAQSMAPRTTWDIPQQTAMPGSGGLAMNVSWPTAMGAAAAAGYSQLRRIGNILYSKAGRILGVMVGSNKITPAKAVVIAKRLGFEAAAAALGISVVELAQMVFSHEESKRKRSNRGISGADIRRTTRTMRKLAAINKLVGGACPPRRRAPAHKHCHH